MINSVSSVSFKAATPANDAISRPGKYTTIEVAQPEKKKDHKALKVVAGLTATALAVCGLLIAGNKRGWFQILDEAALKNAKFFDKCKHYLGKAGNTLTEKAWNPMVKFFTETVPTKCKELWARIKPNKPANA